MSRASVATIVLLSLAGGAAAAWNLHDRATPAVATTTSLSTFEDLPLCPDAPRIWNQRIQPGPRETVSSAVADLDEDGKADLVFVNQQDESLSVWRAATGGFEGTPTRVPAGRSGDRPLIVDHDGDGHLDVILALKDDSAFGILRGRGDGSFAAMERVPQAPPPRQLHWVASTRTLLFSTDSDPIVWRSVAPDTAAWGPMRSVFALVDWTPHTFLRGPGGTAIAMGGRPWSAVELAADGRGTRTRPLERWPANVSAFTADLVDPRGEDELYGFSSLYQILRHDLSDGRPSCRFGGPLIGGTPALADVDGDGIVDAVTSATCAGCTSNQVVWWGGR